MSAANRPILPGFAPPMLVGRERELGVLREQLAAACVGRGSLVLIGGEAGIGKTALAEAICREAAAQGALVLTGRCYDLTETPPYGPFVELFGRYQRPDDGPPLPAAFAQRGSVGEVTSQAALFQHVLDFFTAMASQRPLVVVLDDLHWADPASLDLLRVIARNLRDFPLLVLTPYRSEEITQHHPLSSLLPLLVREANADRLDLHPLDADALHTLVADRSVLPEPDASRLVRYLLERGEGNALFVGELLRSLEETDVLRRTDERWTLGPLTDTQVPPLLRQVISGRVSRLDDESQRQLAIAAIIGQEVPFALWAAVAGADEATVLEVVTEAEAAHLMGEDRDGSGATFMHALIREALYEGVRPSQRRRWHRTVGEVLAALPHPDPDAVASHFQRAGDDRATEWFIAAGERAALAYAWLTAADRFEAALAGIEATGVARAQRGWLLFRTAVMRRWTMPRQGVAYLEEAERVGRDAGDDALVAFAQYYRGLLRCNSGDLGRGITELAAGAAARRALPASERERLLPLLTLLGLEDGSDGQGTLIGWLCKVGRFAEARDIGERALAAMPAASAARGALREDVYEGLGEVYAALGRPEEAYDAFMRAKASFHAVGHHLLVGSTAYKLLSRVLLPYYPERLAERRCIVTEAEEAWARVGGASPAVQRFAALPLMALEGAWTEVRQRALAARAEAPPAYRSTIRQVLAPLVWAQGDTPLAWELVHEALPRGPSTEPGALHITDGLVLQRLGAALALDAGDLTAADDWLAAHDRWLAWSGCVLGRVEAALLRARYHRAVGDPKRAAEHAEQARVLAMEPRQPLALLTAHRTLGELATEAGRFTEAEQHMHTALTLADACAAPFERALTLLAQAELQTATGDRGDAAASLTAVRIICEPLDARPTIERATALAARLTDPRDALSGYPAGLSNREVEVLRLLAAGRTNRDIADTLFLSERTVEVHVRHILTKTNTDNRTAAAAFARVHRLV